MPPDQRGSNQRLLSSNAWTEGDENQDDEDGADGTVEERCPDQVLVFPVQELDRVTARLGSTGVVCSVSLDFPPRLVN